MSINISIPVPQPRIGRIERGFDFLRYHFYPGSLRPSKKAVHKLVEHLRLGCYALEWKRGCNGGCKNIGFYALGRYACSSVSDYVRRWLTWVNSGLKGIKLTIEFEILTAVT